MTPEQMVVAMRQAPWFFFGGVALFVCGVFTGGCVCMTGLLGVMVGACIKGFGSDPFPRGMWFLSSVLWLPSVLLYASLSYLHICLILDHRGGVADVLALGLATWLFGIQSRFLLTATVLNWRVSRR
jgi:hypothetical protein